MTVINWQWLLVIFSSLVMYLVSPWAKSTDDFFKATKRNGEQPKFAILTSSLVISWIFAKSIAVSASLGKDFGLVGGLAYACYYLSFLVAGIVIYKMRTKGNWTSIHIFIRSKFGSNAVRLFSLLIAFRLFNEVWSNTMVVGIFFGESNSFSYNIAIVVFTALTLAYVIKGGLRSSLLTDLIQMLLFGILLIVIVGFLSPGLAGKTGEVAFTGEFTFSQGVNLMLVALLQIFSYPFHDPVMTDRGFVSDAKTTLKSFLWAGLIGFVCILLFSLVGVYGRIYNLDGDPVMSVGRTLGIPMMLIMNFIMITSATSTLDSTFTSFSKLWVVDILRDKQITISKGRMAMVFITIFGTLPIFFGADIISATTISGTMVIGLAPIFIFWKKEVPVFSYYMSIFTGIFFGLALIFKWFPESWFWTDGKYNDLLWVNVIGSIACFTLFLGSSKIYRWIKK
jgi:Na+/proline symporter|tara:strand:+ start:26509 stop:27864 length:1356 start_codon:yes stop_codon:yes gene_type:complete